MEVVIDLYAFQSRRHFDRPPRRDVARRYIVHTKISHIYAAITVWQNENEHVPDEVQSTYNAGPLTAEQEYTREVHFVVSMGNRELPNSGQTLGEIFDLYVATDPNMPQDSIRLDVSAYRKNDHIRTHN